MTRAPHSAVAIDAALSRGDAALIAYLPVGFPSVEDSIRAGKVLADCGVDVIELGFPYSDPGMDGPTIQRATDYFFLQRPRYSRECGGRRRFLWSVAHGVVGGGMCGRSLGGRWGNVWSVVGWSVAHGVVGGRIGGRSGKRRRPEERRPRPESLLGLHRLAP